MAGAVWCTQCLCSNKLLARYITKTLKTLEFESHLDSQTAKLVT